LNRFACVFYQHRYNFGVNIFGCEGVLPQVVVTSTEEVILEYIRNQDVEEYQKVDNFTLGEF
jgi:hypothetical protein